MQLHRQSLTAYGAPLCETIIDAPRPRGSETLVRIERCGVCHSDLHMQDGYFLLGDDKKLDVRAGRTLPPRYQFRKRRLRTQPGSPHAGEPQNIAATHPLTEPIFPHPAILDEARKCPHR